MGRISKKINTPAKTKFEGTREAFADLISKPKWYANILVNGFPINQTNAYQIKYRFSGKANNPISLEYMEQVLMAAGYEIVQPVIWEKKQIIKSI